MSSSTEARNVFVAVHVGAGNHSKLNESSYKDICKKACKQAMLLLKSRASALEAVTAAVAVMEDNELTNCGKGSNLTIQGTVECDASIMDGDTLHFGAVGALSGVSNPVTVAKYLLEEQKLGPLPLGRIRPSILVGKGAQQFCVDRGIGINNNLFSVAAVKTFRRYFKKCMKSEIPHTHVKRPKLEEMSQCHPTAEQSLTSPERSRDDSVHDTVGAVCVDHLGNVASAASSGGIWLKHTGRLGAASVYGAGCWAQNESSSVKPGVAAVTSGCGEQLMKTLLAKSCCDSTRSSDNLTQTLVSSFKETFLESEFLIGSSEKFAGVLLLRTVQNENREVEVAWIHSTASMCLGFLSGQSKAPTATMSRLENNSLPGQSYTMSSQFVIL
ncbi:taspase, threonine aspartase, 1 [Bulinus truncatus]|nr:taspase, threonine aspartase, 1 [Bulinus truncatus]